ncbi:MAG: crotonase/enoyl-CoA hydratase family protein [Gammaproteobacteria bacterium]|nr:crotonase/enoyl-CoA hydratase family protein [Gammaproteobacteria bacterium]
MLDNDLLLTMDGPIARLTLNRPETRNPLGVPGDGARFRAAADAINANRELRCVIMTGAGSAFSAGGDLKAMRDKTGNFGGSPAELRDHYRHSIHGIIHALWDIEVPMIGAINGPAIGLGNDVASLCDIRIASSTARFGATFLKMGLLPGDGGAWLLPRHIGWSRAAQLFFTGELIDADTACKWGLVSEVVPDMSLARRCEDIARSICAQPPQALRMTKKLMREGTQAPFNTIMEMSAALQVTLHQTEDHMEALNAFFDKRTPEFKGR